jgi:hypothetical protein
MENIKSRFKACGTWPLNLALMVKKFGLTKLFTTT